MEIILEKLDYIKDGWNLADISANALATAYLLMYRYNFDPEDRQTILAFANFVCWVRVIGYFRIFEPTRYLIRMIQEIIYSMAAFLLILFSFIIQTALSFMAFNPGEHYYTYWQHAYRLAYGDFIVLDEIETHGMRIFFLLITILLPLVLLNLLIALMSDVYDNVQSSREKEDVSERLRLILEISKFLRWRRKNKEKNYIHLCTNERIQQQEQDQTWEGKVKVLQKNIEKLGQEQSENVKELETTIEKLGQEQSEKISKIENMISNWDDKMCTQRDQTEKKPNLNEGPGEAKVESENSDQVAELKQQIQQMAKQHEDLQNKSE